MRLAAIFMLYKICILLHRCNLKIFAKNRFEKSAFSVKFQKNCKIAHLHVRLEGARTTRASRDRAGAVFTVSDALTTAAAAVFGAVTGAESAVGVVVRDAFPASAA